MGVVEPLLESRPPLRHARLTVKVKGFQVAPAELEGLLLQHPEVVDAAVVSRPHDRHGESVVAFVVRRKSDPAVTEAVTAERIKAFIADRVAEYKRVSEVHFVDAIPKSAAGKILRRILRDQLKNQ